MANNELWAKSFLEGVRLNMCAWSPQRLATDRRFRPSVRRPSASPAAAMRLASFNVEHTQSDPSPVRPSVSYGRSSSVRTRCMYYGRAPAGRPAAGDRTERRHAYGPAGAGRDGGRRRRPAATIGPPALHTRAVHAPAMKERFIRARMQRNCRIRDLNVRMQRTSRAYATCIRGDGCNVNTRIRKVNTRIRNVFARMRNVNTRIRNVLLCIEFRFVSAGLLDR